MDRRKGRAHASHVCIERVGARYYAKITVTPSATQAAAAVSRNAKRPDATPVYSRACLSESGAKREYNRLALYHLGPKQHRFLYGQTLNTYFWLQRMYAAFLRLVPVDCGRDHSPAASELAYGYLIQAAVAVSTLLCLLVPLFLPNHRAPTKHKTLPSKLHKQQHSSLCFAPSKIAVPAMKRTLMPAEAGKRADTSTERALEDNELNMDSLLDVLEGVTRTSGTADQSSGASVGATLALARESGSQWSSEQVDELVQRWFPECTQASCVRSINATQFASSTMALKMAFFDHLSECPHGVLVVHGAGTLRPNMTEPLRQASSEDASFMRGATRVDASQSIRIFDFELPKGSLQHAKSNHGILSAHVRSLGTTHEDARAADALMRRIHASFTLL